MLLEEVEPAVRRIHVGVTLMVFPGGVLRLRKTDVDRFTQGVLAGINTKLEELKRFYGGDVRTIIGQ